MIEHIFMDDCPPEDLLDGPMRPYLSRLEVKLIETGYSKGQIRRLLRTACGLGRYLERCGISLVDAGSPQLKAYSESCGTTRTGRHMDSNTGLSTIQALMKPYGILCKPEPASYADPWLAQFEENQRTVRGLKQDTCAAYRTYLSRFILGGLS